MKKLTLALIILLSTYDIYSQVQYNAGIGFHYEDEISQGIVLVFEHEKFFTSDFSLPLKTDLGLFQGPDYNNITAEVQKGFRKYFSSSIFIEHMYGILGSALFWHDTGAIQQGNTNP